LGTIALAAAGVCGVAASLGGVLSGDDGVIGACAQTGVTTERTAAITTPFRQWFIFDLWLGDYGFSLFPERPLDFQRF
jgi:hypothetical protein